MPVERQKVPFVVRSRYAALEHTLAVDTAIPAAAQGNAPAQGGANDTLSAAARAIFWNAGPFVDRQGVVAATRKVQGTAKPIVTHRPKAPRTGGEGPCRVGHAATGDSPGQPRYGDSRLPTRLAIGSGRRFQASMNRRYLGFIGLTSGTSRFFTRKYS